MTAPHAPSREYYMTSQRISSKPPKLFPILVQSPLVLLVALGCICLFGCISFSRFLNGHHYNTIIQTCKRYGYC